MDNKISLRIVEMSEFFLYLPIDYANSKTINYYNFIPERYEINIDFPPPGKRTDEYAYEMLMSDADQFKDIAICICDPIVILQKNFRQNYEDPIILGSLVKNYSFWGVNHRSHKINQLRDLALYNKVICYEKGTSSYGIVNHIYNIAKNDIKKSKDDFIIEVEPGDELDRLTREEKGTIALSPNLLGIDSLIGESPEYNIDFSLTNFDPYSDTIVTAIITRRSVVEKYPDFIDGFMLAVQRTLNLINGSKLNELDNVIEFARDNYDKGWRASGALENAKKYKVFSTNLGIQKQHWERVVKIYSNYNTISDEEYKQFLCFYSTGIENYSKFAEEAYTTLIKSPNPQKPPKNPKIKKHLKMIPPVLWLIAILISFFLVNNKILLLGFIPFVLIEETFTKKLINLLKKIVFMFINLISSLILMKLLEIAINGNASFDNAVFSTYISIFIAFALGLLFFILGSPKDE